MNQQIYVNLAVGNLEQAQAFYRALGYSFDPRFTNQHGAGMQIADGSIFVMLLTRDFFQTLTDKTVVDPRVATSALLSLSCASQEEVDSLVAKAVAAGGTAPRPANDYGFMYTHDFEDLDGNGWGLCYLRSAPA